MHQRQGTTESGCLECFACVSPLIGAAIFCGPWLMLTSMGVHEVLWIFAAPIMSVGLPLIALGFIPSADAILRKQEITGLEMVSFFITLVASLACIVTLSR